VAASWKDRIKRFGVIVIWFFASYLMLIALAPVVAALAPRGGLMAYFWFVVIGLGTSTVFPILFGRLGDWASARGLIASPSVEAQLEEMPAQELGFTPLVPVSSYAGFEILGLLEQSAFSSTFVARQPGSLTSVALKLPRSDYRSDELVWRLLKCEARMLQSLKGVKGIPVLGSAGTLEDGCPYLLLKPERCHALEDVASSMGLAQVLQAGRSLAKTVARLHAQGVVHRAIHPRSVVIDDFGRVQLQGFEFAVRPGQDKVLNTELLSPRCQPPEQLQRSASVDARVDVYSVGAVLFELLTGELVHGPGTDAELRSRAVAGVDLRKLKEDLPFLMRERHALSVEDAELLSGLLLRCLHPDPMRRFGSARSVIDGLQRLSGADAELTSSLASGPGYAPPTGATVRRPAGRAETTPPRRKPRAQAAFPAPQPIPAARPSRGRGMAAPAQDPFVPRTALRRAKESSGHSVANLFGESIEVERRQKRRVRRRANRVVSRSHERRRTDRDAD